MRLSSIASRPFAFMTGCALAMVACGARSALLEAGASDAGGGDAASADASTDSAPDAGLDAIEEFFQPIDADTPYRLCTLAPSGPQTAAYALSTSSAYTPSLALLSPGTAGGEQPGSFAMQTVVTGSGASTAIHWTSFSAAAGWPDGLQQLGAVATMTSQTFSYAQMAASSADSKLLALSWFGEESGPLGLGFRTIDAESLILSPINSHPGLGNTPLDMVSGRLDNQVSSYLVAWHEGYDGNPPKTERAVAALLDNDGNVAEEAVPVFEAVPYPSPSPVLAWTGTSYLAATSFDICSPGDPLCTERAVVVSRLVQGASAHFEVTATFPAVDAGTRPRQPAFATIGNDVYLAWFERAEADQAPASLRVRHLNADGTAATADLFVPAAARPISPVDLVASDLGLIAHWFEDGDTSLPPGALGYSRLKALHILPRKAIEDVLLSEETIELPVSRFRTRGHPSSVAFAGNWPAAVVAWSGWNGDTSVDAVMMAGIDCEP